MTGNKKQDPICPKYLFIVARFMLYIESRYRL